MKDGPRYATLRDYLRVLREHRVLIVLVTVVFAAVAVFISDSSDPVYQARVSVAFIDPNQDVALIDPNTAASQQAIAERPPSTPRPSSAPRSSTGSGARCARTT